MKSKISIAFLSLCALLVFAGCDINMDDRQQPLKGTELALTLQVDGISLTKTSGPSVAALPEEYTISSLNLFLIKKEGLSSSSAVTEIEPEDIILRPVSDGVFSAFTIIPEDLEGEYLLYAVANMPSWMGTISTYGQLIGQFSGDASNMAACWADNGFLMVNRQNANTAAGIDQAGVTISLPLVPSNDPVVVNVQRLATKICVQNNMSMEVAPLLTEVLCTGDPEDSSVPDVKGAIAAMELKGYALFNCVNSFNLVQRWTAATGSGSQPQLLVSPSSYAGVQTDHSDAYSMTGGYYDNVPGSLTFSDLGTALYCMENNSPYYADVAAAPGDATEGTKMKGRVTGLVFKARAGYAKSFNGEAIVLEPLDVDDNTVPWTTKSGEDNGTNDDIFWTTLYQYKGNFYGDLACLLKHNSALAAALGTTSPNVAQLREKGVKVYEDGYMYYNYWITDPNYTDGGKNYLSVMRNTFYDIKITAINSLGDEFPCGGSSYNPADPISVDVPKLTISMDIPDWTDKSGNYIIQ